MRDDLACKTLQGLGRLIAGTALLIFIPAGTLHFWQAWIYLAIIGGGAAAISLYLWRHDKALLARRLEAGRKAEPEPTQKRILMAASIVFMGPLVIPAFDHRWGWSSVTPSIVTAGDLLVIAGLVTVFIVFRTNSFAAAAVTVAEDQRLITDGLYAVLRHPMYLGILVIMTGTPLALGSWWGLIAVKPVTAILIWRLYDEERVLRARLPGYDAYCREVETRLIPFVW